MPTRGTIIYTQNWSRETSVFCSPEDVVAVKKKALGFESLEELRLAAKWQVAYPLIGKGLQTPGGLPQIYLIDRSSVSPPPTHMRPNFRRDAWARDNWVCEVYALNQGGRIALYDHKTHTLTVERHIHGITAALEEAIYINAPGIKVVRLTQKQKGVT